VSDSLRSQLAEAFHDQARFAAGYSPLYAQLFEVVSGWLIAGGPDPVVDWLLEAGHARAPFDVTLLLPAALHRDVLAGVAAAAPLAAFYPSAGGRAPNPTDPAFANVLRRVILARADALAAFIGGANVQTNETGRGLAWLLPVAALGWPSVHLLELGASAGLNLVADRRAYRLVDAGAPDRALLELGDRPPQFTTTAHGQAYLPPLPCCPAILSRTGGDLYPFHLRTPADELTLTAFLWADQVARVERLREGIAALRAVAVTNAPVRLFPLRLPDDLPFFLRDHTPRPLAAPLVIFNTTVTMYLPDSGASLRGHIATWAEAQSAPVLWLQWEPAAHEGRQDWPRDREGWLAWTADMWRGEPGRREHHHWQLAWVHPHGTALEWTEQIDAFLRTAMQT